jgi:hypothetical protein
VNTGISQRECADQRHRHDQGDDLDAFGVEQRDHGQRADVVDHRQREQEDPQPGRVFGFDDGQRADEEGGVGRDHHTPSLRVLPRRIEQQEDDGRHGEACDRGDDGHGGPGSIGEFADSEFAGDFEAHDEKEECHQAVVDQMLDRQVEGMATKRESDVSVQQRPIRLCPRRIGPKDRC